MIRHNCVTILDASMIIGTGNRFPAKTFDEHILNECNIDHSDVSEALKGAGDWAETFKGFEQFIETL